MLIFLGWIIGVVMVYAVSGGRRPSIFTTLTVLLCVVLAWHTGFCPTLTSVLFISCFHSGTTLIALACLGIMIGSAFNGYSRLDGVLSALLFLGVSSDPLLLIIFTVPTIMTLALMAWNWPQRFRTATMLGANIGLSSFLGFFIRPYLFPISLASGYVKISGGGIAKSLGIFWQVLSSPQHEGFIFLLGLDFTAVILGCLVVMPFSPWYRRDALSPAHYFLLAYGAFLITCSWAATFLTGNYLDDLCLRYASFALVYPLILIVGWMAESIPWGQFSTRILFVAVSMLTAAMALVLPAPSDYYREAQLAIPVLKKVMSEENVQSGLADYWYGSVFTFLSHQTVPLRIMNSEGKMSHWFNNLEDYTSKDTSGVVPCFRLVAMGHMDPEAIKVRYGNPIRIIPTPANWDIWIFPPDDAIRYSPIFSELGNRRYFPTPAQFKIPAAQLPSQNGKIEGDSIVARSGIDPDRCLTYGPYIHPVPGTYRVDLTYAYEVSPAPGKEVTCDGRKFKEQIIKQLIIKHYAICGQRSQSSLNVVSELLPLTERIYFLTP